MATSQVQIIMSGHINDSGRLFGGQLMAWIDVVAAIEARRHTKTSITTATVDHLDFLSPAYLGDMVRIDARLTWTGTTSLEVIAESYVESLSGEEDRLINRAILVYVALDKDGIPIPVPRYVPQSDRAQKDWEEAEQRAIYRKKLRAKQKEEQTL